MAESSHSLVASCWGDESFADASIIMGQKTWPVHLLIICKQSKYFEKAFKGQFMEAKTKTIDLMNCDFLEEEVDGLLKYLYTRELDARQAKDAARTFLVADYFQVAELRDRAAAEASGELQALLSKGLFLTFGKRCQAVLREYPATDLEAAMVEVLAANARVVIYDSGAWAGLVALSPGVADKVLRALVPEHVPVVVDVKPPAAVAAPVEARRVGRPRGSRNQSSLRASIFSLAPMEMAPFH